MAQTKITIRIDESRAAMTLSYSTVGKVAGLVTNDVGNVIQRAPLPPKTGSKAYWESVLTQVLADITAGNGGGT